MSMPTDQPTLWMAKRPLEMPTRVAVASTAVSVSVRTKASSANPKHAIVAREL